MADDEEAIGELRNLIRRQRHHAPDYAPLGKSRDAQAEAELHAVRSLLEQMELDGNAPYTKARSPHLGREVDQSGRPVEWPDVVALNGDGEEVAFEVTELVDGDSIAAVARLTDEQLREGYRADQVWPREKILERVRRLIAKKDARASGEFAESVLVICTSEIYIAPEPTIEVLRGEVFELPHGNVDRVFVLFGYAGLVGRPYVELALRR
jgi:hypothetical protein